MDFSPSWRIASRLESGANHCDDKPVQDIPVFLSLKCDPHFRQFPHCSFEGFHYPEIVSGHPVLWTGRKSMVKCSFPVSVKIAYVWLEFANTHPHGSPLRVHVNGQCACDVRSVKGRATVRVSVPGTQHLTEMILQLETEPFVPREVTSESSDDRELGVALRAIAFAKKRRHYRAAMDFRRPISAQLIRVWQSVFEKAA